MGVNYNPRVVTNGLVLALDASNQFKSAKGFKNINSLSDWSLGTGGTASYFQVGLTSENQRILDTGPFGVSTVVWDNGTTDVDSNDDGGFVTSNYTIDPTKLYRFSVWMRRKVIGNGASYLGCHAWDASTTQHVLNRSNGSTNINPYFLASNYWGNVNEWYLVTGHIWPAGSGTGTSKVDSGIYTAAGTKISDTTDFVWQTTNTYTQIRSFLYYSTDTTTKQQLYQPRIDLVDGTEPTIAELIAGVGSKWYDVIGSNHGNILNSAALYNTSGYMNFDGVDDTVDVGPVSQIGSSLTSMTVSVWVYPTSASTRLILENGTNHATNTFYLAQENSSYFTFEIYGTNYDVVYANYVYQLNTWYNLVGIWRSGSRVDLYTNGILTNGTRDGVAQTSVINGNTNLFVGSRAGSSLFYSGRINQPMMYNRALSAAEIQQNFNAIRGRFGI